MSKKPAATKAKRKPKSVGRQIADGLRELVEDMKSGRPLDEKYNVRTVKIELKPGEYSPKEVVATRELLGLSQALFATFLGVSTNAVQTWEQGQKPSGIACRFMDEIRRDPDYWRRRLKSSVSVTRPAAMAGRRNRITVSK